MAKKVIVAGDIPAGAGALCASVNYRCRSHRRATPVNYLRRIDVSSSASLVSSYNASSAPAAILRGPRSVPLCASCARRYLDVSNQDPHSWRDATEKAPSLARKVIRYLKKAKKTPADVFRVGSADGKWSMSWADFAAGEGAKNTTKFPMDFVVVGDGWWLSTRKLRYNFSLVFNTPPPGHDPDGRPFRLEDTMSYRSPPVWVDAAVCERVATLI